MAYRLHGIMDISVSYCFDEESCILASLRDIFSRGGSGEWLERVFDECSGRCLMIARQGA